MKILKWVWLSFLFKIHSVIIMLCYFVYASANQANINIYHVCICSSIRPQNNQKIALLGCIANNKYIFWCWAVLVSMWVTMDRNFVLFFGKFQLTDGLYFILILYAYNLCMDIQYNVEYDIFLTASCLSGKWEVTFPISVLVSWAELEDTK